jgi:hypothetical protein
MASYILDFVAQGRQLMLEVHHGDSRGQRDGNIHLRIFQANTFVRATAEDEVVLGVHIGRPLLIQPPLWIKGVRLRINFGVVKRVIK